MSANMQVSGNRAPKDLQVCKDVAPEMYVCVREEVQGTDKISMLEEHNLARVGTIPKV